MSRIRWLTFSVDMIRSWPPGSSSRAPRTLGRSHGPRTPAESRSRCCCQRGVPSRPSADHRASGGGRRRATRRSHRGPGPLALGRTQLPPGENASSPAPVARHGGRAPDTLGLRKHARGGSLILSSYSASGLGASCDVGSEGDPAGWCAVAGIQAQWAGVWHPLGVAVCAGPGAAVAGFPTAIPIPLSTSRFTLCGDAAPRPCSGRYENGVEDRHGGGARRLHVG
jgi:hypothetical protein